MILDDGGDATLYILLGEKGRKPTRLPRKAGLGEEEYLFAQIKKRMEASPGWFRQARPRIKGVTEETTTGVNRLYQMEKRRAALPGHQRERQRHQVEIRQQIWLQRSLVDGIRRGTDVMMAGKKAVVCGYGDVGKGSAASLQGPARASRSPRSTRSARCRRRWTATKSLTLEEAAPKRHLHHRHRQQGRRHGRPHAGDEGHGDRLQYRPLRQRDSGRRLKNIEWTNIKPQVDMIDLPGLKAHSPPVRRPSAEPRQCHRPPVS
jgi:adenosylhomocysteinase